MWYSPKTWEPQTRAELFPTDPYSPGKAFRSHKPSIFYFTPLRSEEKARNIRSSFQRLSTSIPWCLPSPAIDQIFLAGRTSDQQAVHTLSGSF